MITIDNIPSSNEWMNEGRFVEGMTLSESGRYHYRSSPVRTGRTCDQDLISVYPTIFGGKIRATCMSAVVQPHTIWWRLYIGADGLGKPHGSLTVDIKDRAPEEWDPILQDMKSFIDSMREQGR